MKPRLRFLDRIAKDENLPQQHWAIGIESTNGGIITFAGGIPLKSIGGKLLGAIGVSGGTVDQDYEIAQSGAAVLVVQPEKNL